MFKAVDKWLLGYLRSILRRPRAVKGTRHLILAVCDHFEPFRDQADPANARQNVKDWLTAYPLVADAFRDADGHPPRHTFFYPQEEYDAAILDDLASFCRKGYGEVEIHLHHRHDTPEGFRKKLESFRDLLHEKHGLLGVESRIQNPGSRILNPEPRTLNPDVSPLSLVRFAFIHGNWALCNARPDGDWCGVNEELGILAQTGCYADFTFPSAPSPTQPRMVNALYYARDIPTRPRGADRGMRVKAIDQCESAGGSRRPGGCIGKRVAREYVRRDGERHLLLITGPLALNWRRRKWGIFPRLENAEITGVNPPTADRVRLWARQQIHVEGRPDWVFVKLHTHGCVPANQPALLGESMRQAHEILQQEFNDGQNWQLHYVTAREMANLVKAAEANLPGAPGQYRDCWIGPPFQENEHSTFNTQLRTSNRVIAPFCSTLGVQC